MATKNSGGSSSSSSSKPVLFRNKLQRNHTFGLINEDNGNNHDYEDEDVRSCLHCRQLSVKTANDDDDNSGGISNAIWSCNPMPGGDVARGDDLFQCLDCDYMGCGPSWSAKHTNEHIVQHMLLSNHSFGEFSFAQSTLV